MKLDWFSDALIKALPQSLAGDPHVLKCAEEMLRIAARIGATAVDDGAPDEAAAQTAALSALGDAFRRHVATALCCIGPDDTDRYYYEFTGAADGPLRPAELKPRLNINTADRKALIALPGIGEVLAERIIRTRHLNGPFPSVEALKSIEGMTDARYQKFDFMVTAGSTAPPRPLPPAAAELLDAPSVVNFLAFLASPQQGGNGAPPDAASLVALHGVLIDLADRVRTAPLTGRQLIGATRASRQTAVAKADALAAMLDGNAASDVAGAGLLLDAQYPAFIEQAIEAAQSQIDIAMFYISLSDNPFHRNVAIFNKFEAAKGRGVAIRVILDRDKQGDIYLSREINKPAFDRLTAMGVEVKFDSETELLHTKLLVFDRTMVVVGSHNMTAGSYERYDDVSLFAKSPALGAHYTAWFDGQFA